MKHWNWKHICFSLLAIAVLSQFVGYLGRSTTQHANERKAASAPSSHTNQEIRVVVSSQDSEGASQQNFDLNFLNNLEAYTIERVKLKSKEYLVSTGQPNADVSFISEATYVESGPIKLAVIRLRASEGSNQVFISGIIGKELKRVACVRDSTESIPISYGICAKKIHEVFGVNIGG